MPRWMMALVGGALVLSAGVPAVSSAHSAGQDVATVSLDDELSASGPSQSPGTHPGDEDADVHEGDDHGRSGPPPWAHGGKARSHDKSMSAWKAMTTAQREATMARLVREQTAGINEFSACVAAGRHDCVKPLPPGLAKRL